MATSGPPFVLRRPAGVLMALALGALLFACAPVRGVPESFADIVAPLIPTVVGVAGFKAVPPGEAPAAPPGLPVPPAFEEFFEDAASAAGNEGGQAAGARRMVSLGSGVIVDPSGLIATCDHVIGEADEIAVLLDDGTPFLAHIVGRDPETDLALIEVKAAHPLPAAHFGDSGRVRVGDWVVAIGNPFGLGNTVSVGIVSARERDIGAGAYGDFLQTDAPLNRGDSGGPLFDTNGELVGINTVIFSPSGESVGIGFAIPAARARLVLERLREQGGARSGGALPLGQP